jgi:putative ABC transport system permease protein
VSRATFLWRTLRSDLGEFTLLALALAIGVGALCLFGTLGVALERTLHRLFPDADRTLEVVPPRLALGGLSASLDEPMVKRLRALPDVSGASPRMLLRVPAVSFYEGNFFGHDLNFAVEIAAQGVEPGLLQSDLPPGESFTDRPGAAIPACISDRLLAIYNGTFAPARNLPQLSPKLLLGFELPVTIGRTFFSAGSGVSESVVARVVCVSPLALLAGLTLPLETVKRLNRAHGQDAEAYSSVSLVAESPADLERLRVAVTDLGLGVDDADAPVRALGRATGIGSVVLLLLGALLVLLAVSSIAQSLTLHVRGRTAEIGLLRALGATPGDVAGWVLAQAAVIGLTGGALGISMAAAAELALRGSLVRFLLAAPVPIANLLGFEPSIAACSLAVAVVAACAGAYFPARLAARLDPARAMAD